MSISSESERMKTLSAIASLLCALLLLSLGSNLFVVSVNAAGYDYGYGHAMALHACDANPTAISELRYVYWAFNEIYGLFDGVYNYRWDPYEGQYFPDSHVYGRVTHSMEWNGGDPYSTTTVADVLNGISHTEDFHESSAFLYVGHTSAYVDPGYGKWRYGFYMHGKGTDVRSGQVPHVTDSDIWENT